MAELGGAFAASVTSLRDGGAALDEKAIGPSVAFLVEGGMRGVLALGTAGEGILLTVSERRRVAERFVEAAPEELAVFVHCGAQTTADTVALATHAAEIGADGVAVIGPPYFAIDEQAMVRHFTEAAGAAFPLPFYLYEFAARTGYEVPPEAVSALAAAFPDVVSAAVASPTEEAAARAGELRAAVQRFPIQAALKTVLGLRGVPVREDVRAPLRTLDSHERRELEGIVEEALAGVRA